jgi:hypothetical protein
MTSLFKIVFSSTEGQTKTEVTPTRRLFGNFILQYVSTLVVRGLIYDRELYHSYITPRYDDAPDYEREVVYFEAPNRHRLEANGRPGWLSEPQKSGEPLRYFTLTLCTAPRHLVYRRDFPLAVLDPEISRRADLLNPPAEHREWKWEIIALSSDANAPLDSQSRPKVSISSTPNILLRPVSLPVEKNSPLEEHLEISIQDVSGDLSIKSLPSGPNQIRGTMTADGLKIMISRDTLQEIKLETTKRLDVEGGGLLIGEAFREETSEELVVHITAHIPAEGAHSTVGSIRFTSRVWNAMLQTKQQKFPSAQVVGWYHDHSAGTWMSVDDKFIHRNIFKEPWQVALILSKYDGTSRFFRWRGGRVVPSNWFQIIG